MKALFVALFLTAFGGAFYKLGTPSVRTYPAPDGTMVVRLTLSRAPWFVAYFRTGARRALPGGSGAER